jgi:hypothetical protein
MLFGNVEGGEVVEVVLDMRTFRHREAHVGEDRRQLVHDLADRMDAAGLLRPLAHRQGDVDALGGQPALQLGLAQRLAAGLDGGVDAVLETVDRRALLAPLIRAHARRAP